MAVKQDIIDELLANYNNPQDPLGDDGIFKRLKRALLERTLNAELDDHPGYLLMKSTQSSYSMR